ALQKLKKKNEFGYETLPHLPYSPDLPPIDYHFFKHLGNFLDEECFTNHDDTKSAFKEFIGSRTLEFH
ncbi:hypothetical protein Angca_006726, partial [Angiostrongylus cantonensis]